MRASFFVVLLAGCATAAAPLRTKSFLAPPVSAFDAVQVSFDKATTAKGSLLVDLRVKNGGNGPIEIDLRQWSLRLPDASTVAIDAPEQSTLTLASGEAKPVHARFPILSGDPADLRSAEVVVGGVVATPNAPAAVVGTIPLNAVDTPASP